jgi:hypothetical protein
MLPDAAPPASSSVSNGSPIRRRRRHRVRFPLPHGVWFERRIRSRHGSPRFSRSNDPIGIKHLGYGLEWTRALQTFEEIHQHEYIPRPTAKLAAKTKIVATQTLVPPQGPPLCLIVDVPGGFWSIAPFGTLSSQNKACRRFAES